MSDKLKVFAVVVLVLAAVIVLGVTGFRTMQQPSQTSSDKQAEYEKMVLQRQQSHTSPYAARAATAATSAPATTAPQAGK